LTVSIKIFCISFKIVCIRPPKIQNHLDLISPQSV
jgi:hypothetical protein